jgi:hypothetical protein
MTRHAEAFGPRLIVITIFQAVGVESSGVNRVKRPSSKTKVWCGHGPLFDSVEFPPSSIPAPIEVGSFRFDVTSEGDMLSRERRAVLVLLNADKSL